MNTILLVDDDAVLASAEVQMLETAGYRVITATDGDAAAAACSSDDCSIDIILMDIDLGPDADGVRTAESILATRDVPIIFCYSADSPALLEKIASVHSYGCIQKQTHITVVRAAIETALKLHKAHIAHKRTERAFQESERVLREFIEKMPDGVYKSTHDGHFLEINPAMVKILGYASREELMAIDIKSELYFAPTDRESAALEEKLEEMAVFRLRKKDGSEVWVEDHGSHVVDEHGTVLYHEGILRDVTERIHSERQLLQAQKLEGIGTLAGGIAHDFNNLLAMILGAAELLGKQMSHTPQLKKYVDRIIEASERGASISRQLLIFSRPDQAELKPVSLSKIIAELQEMLKHFLPKSITIETRLDPDDGVILGDEGQIHQALLNLALNASDAMGGRGVLTIGKNQVEAKTLRADTVLPESMPYIGVSITDTGIGMEQDVIAKIFEPFFSTKERTKGTGLGLAIVHGIVKNHHGFIDVESVPGTGTTFTLFFPAAAHAPGTDVREVIRPQEHPGETILLVDDEKIIREMLVEFLEEIGYIVMPAVNGTEALRLYEKYHMLIDLVITDLGMPELGGEELFKRLKLFDPQVRVIVSSGYLDGSTKADLLGIGVKDVLTKPYKFEEIRRVIRETLKDPLVNTASQ
jgi:PAS domain S-box-containing protein